MASQKRCIAALDVGTTSGQGGLFTLQLELLACAVQEYALHTWGECAEVEAGQYKAAVRQGLQQALAAAPGWAVAAVGLATQGETLAPVSEAGEALRPFLVWLDSRAGAEAAELSRLLGGAEFYRATGLPEPTGALPLAKLLWLRRHEPAVYQKAHKFPAAGGLSAVLAHRALCERKVHPVPPPAGSACRWTARGPGAGRGGGGAAKSCPGWRNAALRWAACWHRPPASWACPRACRWWPALWTRWPPRWPRAAWSRAWSPRPPAPRWWPPPVPTRRSSAGGTGSPSTAMPCPAVICTCPSATRRAWRCAGSGTSSAGTCPPGPRGYLALDELAGQVPRAARGWCSCPLAGCGTRTAAPRPPLCFRGTPGHHTAHFVRSVLESTAFLLRDFF